MGRALVKIETATEQEYIAKAARESGVFSYWIGLSSLVDPALFAWEDGTPVFEYPTRTGCVTDLTFKQRCYESFVEWGDFQTNRSRCHGLGTGWELAALRTLQEEQFVRSFIQDSELFLAGSDATEEGRWRWLTADILFWVGLADGAAQVAPHTNGTEHAGWEPGQPNNDLNAESGMDADCLVIHPLGWSDVPCGDAVFGALCEQAGSTIDGQYAHFGADQPNDGDASCVLVPEDANTWWDASCELQLGFVCE